MQNNSANNIADVANITVVTDDRQIIVPHTITEVVEVNTPGPQGPVGPQGVAGPSEPFANIGGGVYATTSSIQVTGSFLVSGSSTFTNIGPAIFSGSATITGPTTMSSAVVTGNVQVLGTASINVLQINTTINSTGSNILGDASNDTQTLFGAVIVPTGSLTITGSLTVSSSNATQLLVGGNLLFVSRSGNVGIGTNTPAYTLDVNGTIRSQGQLIVVGQIQNPTIGVVDVNGVLYSGTGVSVGVNSTNAAKLLVRGSGTTTSTTALRVENSSASPSLVVLDNGYVGIGTSSAQYQLDLYGTYHQYQAQGGIARYDISSANANQNRGVWDFYTNAAVSPDFFGRFGFKFEGGTADSFKQFQVHVADSTTPKFVIDGSGRVGIGTTSSLTTLDVRTTNNSTITPLSVAPNDATTLLVGNTGTNGVLAFGHNNTGQGWIQGRSRLAGGSAEPILLNPLGGNILINTTTDNGYRLQVNATGSNSGSLFVGGTNVASGGIATTMLISSSLSASANSDVLVGLEINPTFTNGAFTGVKNNWINLVGNASVNFTNQLYLKRGDVDVLFASSAETQLKTVSSLAPLKFFVGSTSQYAQFFATTGNLTLQNGGTFTDAGFRLDVSGSARITNGLTVTGSISTSTNTTGQSTLGTGLVVNNTAGSSTINDFQVKSQLYNAIYVSSSADSIGLMSNASGKLGFFGATPTTQSAGWSVANYLVSKSFDANTVTLEQLADVVGTILTELKNKGLLG